MNTIPFKQLKKYNDSNSFVWMALLVKDEEQKKVEAFLKENKFLPADASIVEMRKISENVRGDDGRTDILFITTPTTFNPLVRLQIADLKWTSDFRANYSQDYR